MVLARRCSTWGDVLGVGDQVLSFSFIKEHFYGYSSSLKTVQFRVSLVSYYCVWHKGHLVFSVVFECCALCRSVVLKFPWVDFLLRSLLCPSSLPPAWFSVRSVPSPFLAGPPSPRSPRYGRPRLLLPSVSLRFVSWLAFLIQSQWVPGDWYSVFLPVRVWSFGRSLYRFFFRTLFLIFSLGRCFIVLDVLASSCVIASPEFWSDGLQPLAPFPVFCTPSTAFVVRLWGLMSLGCAYIRDVMGILL